MRMQVLDAREITKRYGTVVANDRVTLSIRPGEVLGLLGENGAGKSTLLGILAGMVTPDDGEVLMQGRPLTLRGPADAIRHGIGMVHQHFSLVPTLTVREQLRLVGWRRDELPDLLQGRVDADARIATLSLGQQQRVEIARALAREPRILLMDEPTSILAPTEVEELFALIRAVRDRGVAVVLVTHKLREALALAHRIVVMRRGAVVAERSHPTGAWPPSSEAELLHAMFGEAPPRAEKEAHEGPIARPALLSVRGLTARRGPRRRAVHDVWLDVRAGEVCALVGIDGQGQRELAELLTGYHHGEGEIWLQGRSLAGVHARDVAAAGIGYLSDDRRGEGGVPTMSLTRNLLLKRQRRRPFSRSGILREGAVRADARRLVTAWGIAPPDIDLPLDLFSGGNIQKALLAREMALAPTVLVANKPTHGLDARTGILVWQAMRQIALRGGGVLVLTTELDEAMEHADRIGVILDGRVSPLTPVARASRMELARMMVGEW